MRKQLKIPAVLAFVVGSSAAITASCGDDGAPVDASASCSVYCVPIGSDASNCPNHTVCVDQTSGTCPAGCEPEPVV